MESKGYIWARDPCYTGQEGDSKKYKMSAACGHFTLLPEAVATHTPWLSLKPHNSERFLKASLPSTRSDSSEFSGTLTVGTEATGGCVPCCVAANLLSVLPDPTSMAGSGSALVGGSLREPAGHFPSTAFTAQPLSRGTDCTDSCCFIASCFLLVFACSTGHGKERGEAKHHVHNCYHKHPDWEHTAPFPAPHMLQNPADLLPKQHAEKVQCPPT